MQGYIFHDNTDRCRYELHSGDQIAFADYRREKDLLTIDHVEAPVALRGTGAAGILMQHIAEHAKAEGLTIIPLCPYAAAWLRRHAP